MKNFSKILVTLFMLTVSCFILFGCDDKEEDKAPTTEVKCDPACTENQECKMIDEKATCVEKVVEEVKCEPECDADKQECKLVEDKPACVDKAPVADEPECSEAKPCTDDKVCKEGKCEEKTEEPVKPEPECSEAKPCTDNKVCNEGKCEEVVTVVECSVDKPCTDDKVCDNGKCVAKVEEPAKPEPKCEPVCGENKECKCEADKCECVDKVLTEEPKPEVFECGEGKPECPEDKVCKEGKCEAKAE